MERQQPMWKDWRLHLGVLIASLIAEKIGSIRIPVGIATVTLLPLLFSMLIMVILYLIKPIKLLGEKQAAAASPMMALAMIILMAKLGITSGGSIKEIISSGPILVLQNLGNLGTILFALPVALLLGLKRESIGLTHALSREANVAVISDKYGPNSSEFKGVMTVYVVGTIFGTIFMSVIPPLFVSLGVFSPQSAAMGVGAGSAAMMTAGVTALIDQTPELESALIGFANISNLISSAVAVYLAVFLGLPLCEKMYSKLEPILGRKKKAVALAEEANIDE